MKLTIEGTEKEIADLVRIIQGQQYSKKSPEVGIVREPYSSVRRVGVVEDL